MSREAPVTFVQQWLHRRWRLWTPFYLLLGLVFVAGVVSVMSRMMRALHMI